MNRQNLVVGIGSFLIGAGIGYIGAQKFLEGKYAAIAEMEIEDAREFYAKKEKSGPYSTPEGAAEVLLDLDDVEGLREAASALTEYAGRDVVKERVEEELVEVTSNVFTNAKVPLPEFDLAEEIKKRDPEVPYLVTHDEYFENGLEYEQVTLTYYAGDGVLADENDEPINTVDDTVNTENLQRFGEGSNDINVVYVRNVEIKTDFEIIRSDGFFSREVLGLEAEEEIRHSERYPRVRPGRRLRDD